jgi:sulfhydrogenase subunit delta
VPRTPVHSVCLDCKIRGTVCIAVSRGVPCMGPITQTGCGALCPAYDRACYTCFGPVAQANPSSLTSFYHSQGVAIEELIPLLRNYNAYSPEFRAESDRLERRLPLPLVGGAS